MAERTIVDIGKALAKYGLNIGEHPAFGGVGKGHSPTGYHPIGMAIDVRDWRPDMAPAYTGGKPKHWKERTGELSWRAKQLGLFNEALGPGDKGHDTHVHLALEGKKPITDQQLEWLATGRTTQGGKLTDVMPGATLPAPLPTTAVQQELKEDTSADEVKYALFQQLLNQSQQPSLTQQLLNQELSRLMPTQGLLG